MGLEILYLSMDVRVLQCHDVVRRVEPSFKWSQVFEALAPTCKENFLVSIDVLVLIL